MPAAIREHLERGQVAQGVVCCFPEEAGRSDVAPLARGRLS